MWTGGLFYFINGSEFIQTLWRLPMKVLMAMILSALFFCIQGCSEPKPKLKSVDANIDVPLPSAGTSGIGGAAAKTAGKDKGQDANADTGKDKGAEPAKTGKPGDKASDASKEKSPESGKSGAQK
jgi:hypothetical protein